MIVFALTAIIGCIYSIWQLVDQGVGEILNPVIQPLAPVPSHALGDIFALQAKIQNAQTEGEIVGHLLQHSGRYGATHLLAGIVPARQTTRRQQLDHVLLNAYPDDWVTRYFENGYIEQDPAIWLARQGLDAFFWNEIGRYNPLSRSARNIMGEAADIGLREGFTVTLPMLHGGHVALSIAGERLELSRENQRIVSLMAYIATGRVLQFKHLAGEGRHLNITARERLVAQLAANGFREAEIADRLEITIHGVDKHMRSLRKKLNVRTAAQVVAICLREGIIV